MDTIAKDHSYRTLLASGTSVGLSEGLMGNSEVGYVLIYRQKPKAVLTVFFFFFL